MNKPICESVAKVLVVNEKNEGLILTISEYPGHPEKSFTPDLPGGMVDPGETERFAVRRELEEEAGITLDDTEFQLAYVKTEFFEAKNKSVTKSLYLAFISETPPVTISWEHAEYEWLPLSTIHTSVELRPFYREAVDYCFAIGLIAD